MKTASTSMNLGSTSVNGFEQALMRTLRYALDSERQIKLSLSVVPLGGLRADLRDAVVTMKSQLDRQITRLDDIFRVLYCEPRGQTCWVAVSLLRDAWDSADLKLPSNTEGCASALLALVRHQLCLYEALLHWCNQCALDEALYGLRRTTAEKVLVSAMLAEIAYHPGMQDRVEWQDRPAIN